MFACHRTLLTLVFPRQARAVTLVLPHHARAVTLVRLSQRARAETIGTGMLQRLGSTRVIAADVVGKLVVVECLGAYVGVVVGVLALHAVSK